MQNSPLPFEGQTDSGTPRKPRKRVPNWVKITGAVLALALLVGIGYAGVYLWNLNNAFNKSETLENAFPEKRQEAVAGTQNILLLGSDTRGEIGDDVDDVSGQRADTIMVAHVPSSRESVEVMSIMRDNWVTLPDGSEAKINAALARGGVPMMVETVESLIGVRIDRVAIIDFEGFKGLTESLGGVTVDNPEAFSDDGQFFDSGEITLQGEDALTFVRARYPFADGDYTRVANQQLFLKSIATEMLSKETLTNPAKVQQSVEAISPYLAVDSGFTSSYLVSEALGLRNIRGDNLRFFTSPTNGTGTSADGQSIVVPDWEAWEELRMHFKNDTVSEWTP